MRAQDKESALSRPLVTVIIPAHNHGHYVCQAVDCALGQAWQPVEVIVVDDGSQDDTPLRMQAYAGRVVYVRQENRGLSGARNTGLRHATGRYVQFLDADDLLDGDKIRRQVEALEADAGAGIAYGDAAFFQHDNPDGRTLYPEYQGARDVTPETISGRNPFPVNAVLVRRDLFAAVGNFDESLRSLEDWDLWMRAVLSGVRAIYVPGSLCLIRVHGSNMSRNRVRMAESCVRVLAKNLSGLPGEVSRTAGDAMARELAVARWDLGRTLMSAGHRWRGFGRMLASAGAPRRKGNRVGELALGAGLCLCPPLGRLAPSRRFLQAYGAGSRYEVEPAAPSRPPAEGAPLVSVVVCAYNAEKFIERTLRSILAQQYRPMEIVLIDDGSRDRTGEVVRRLAQAHPEIKYHYQENRGRHEAANEGIRRASGKYIAVNDHDDLSVPERLTWEVEFLESHPDYALVGGWADVVDRRGRRCATWKTPCDWETIRRPEESGNCFLHSSVMYRREAALAVGLYRQEFDTSGDADFTRRITERYKAGNLPRVMYKYTIMPGCASVKRAQECRFYGIMVNRFWRERRDTGSDRLQRGEPFLTPGDAAELDRIRHCPRLRSVGFHDWAEIFHEAGLWRGAVEMAVRAVRTAPGAFENWRMLLLCVCGRRVHGLLRRCKRTVIPVIDEGATAHES